MKLTITKEKLEELLLSSCNRTDEEYRDDQLELRIVTCKELDRVFISVYFLKCDMNGSNDFTICDETTYYCGIYDKHNEDDLEYYWYLLRYLIVKGLNSSPVDITNYFNN